MRSSVCSGSGGWPGRSSPPGQLLGRPARHAGADADDRTAEGSADRPRRSLDSTRVLRAPDLFGDQRIDQPQPVASIALHLVLTSLHSLSSLDSSSSTSSSRERPVWVMKTSWSVAA